MWGGVAGNIILHANIDKQKQLQTGSTVLKYNGLLENNLSTLDRLGGTVDDTDHPPLTKLQHTVEHSKAVQYQLDTESSQYSVQQGW